MDNELLTDYGLIIAIFIFIVFVYRIVSLFLKKRKEQSNKDSNLASSTTNNQNSQAIDYSNSEVPFNLGCDNGAQRLKTHNNDIVTERNETNSVFCSSFSSDCGSSNSSSSSSSD